MKQFGELEHLALPGRASPAGFTDRALVGDRIHLGLGHDCASGSHRRGCLHPNASVPEWIESSDPAEARLRQTNGRRGTLDRSFAPRGNPASASETSQPKIYSPLDEFSDSWCSFFTPGICRPSLACFIPSPTSTTRPRTSRRGAQRGTALNQASRRPSSGHASERKE